ncbi:hypothetical protein [Roseivivax sediminis]|uniref:Uncharacterized protein n=1 Tax=Roseivivax sediminis TaxID=936889 RepID=A0A1I2BXX2_9RHOB|nr:hypothetical protein [Roseivivax sediminis]SFE60303.1 hypothetical protein SAMN04515678_11212 [Roseivivax sediminis]
MTKAIAVMFGTATFAFLTLVPLPAGAQNVEWTNTIAIRGEGEEGLELRLRVDQVTDKMSKAHIIHGICNHFLPFAVPLVKDKAALSDPRFVTVRIATRSWDLVLGAGGRWQATYDIQGDKCGDEMLAERRWTANTGNYLR